MLRAVSLPWNYNLMPSIFPEWCFGIATKIPGINPVMIRRGNRKDKSNVLFAPSRASRNTNFFHPHSFVSEFDAAHPSLVGLVSGRQFFRGKT